MEDDIQNTGLLPAGLVAPFATKLLRFVFRLAEKEPQLSENEIARALEVWDSVLEDVNSEVQKSFARRLVHQVLHLDDKTYEFTETDKVLTKRVLGAVSGYFPSSSLIKVYSRKLGI